MFVGGARGRGACERGGRGRPLPTFGLGLRGCTFIADVVTTTDVVVLPFVVVCGRGSGTFCASFGVGNEGVTATLETVATVNDFEIPVSSGILMPVPSTKLLPLTITVNRLSSSMHIRRSSVKRHASYISCSVFGSTLWMVSATFSNINLSS